MHTHPRTRISHHVLCLMFQPVHIVELDRLLVLAASVVGLAHRGLWPMKDYIIEPLIEEKS